MARSAPPPPQRPHQTPDQKRGAIRRLEACIADLEAFDPTTLTQRDHNPQVTDIEAGIDAALTAAFGFGTPDDLRYRPAANLDHGPRSYSIAPGWFAARGGAYDTGEHPSEFQRYFREGKDQASVLLRRAIKQLNDEISEQEAPLAGPATVAASGTTRPGNAAGKVFVVHGHDEAAKHELARFLAKIGLAATILQEQPDRGQTIIEKFEASAAEVEFAVVLMTPDDIMAPPEGATGVARARQNVIFEMGYFCRALGKGRVCLLRKGAVEVPSDLHGVIYTDFDETGGWKLKLGQELKAAGMPVDAAKLLD